MPLSWNEIKDRSIRFSKEWETETSEDADANRQKKDLISNFSNIELRNYSLLIFRHC